MHAHGHRVPSPDCASGCICATRQRRSGHCAGKRLAKSSCVIRHRPNSGNGSFHPMHRSRRSTNVRVGLARLARAGKQHHLLAQIRFDLRGKYSLDGGRFRHAGNITRWWKSRQGISHACEIIGISANVSRRVYALRGVDEEDGPRGHETTQ